MAVPCCVLYKCAQMAACVAVLACLLWPIDLCAEYGVEQWAPVAAQADARRDSGKRDDKDKAPARAFPPPEMQAGRNNSARGGGVEPATTGDPWRSCALSMGPAAGNRSAPPVLQCARPKADEGEANATDNADYGQFDVLAYFFGERLLLDIDTGEPAENGSNKETNSSEPDKEKQGGAETRPAPPPIRGTRQHSSAAAGAVHLRRRRMAYTMKHCIVATPCNRFCNAANYDWTSDSLCLRQYGVLIAVLLSAACLCYYAFDTLVLACGDGRRAAMRSFNATVDTVYQLMCTVMSLCVCVLLVASIQRWPATAFRLPLELGHDGRPHHVPYPTAWLLAALFTDVLLCMAGFELCERRYLVEHKLGLRASAATYAVSPPAGPVLLPAWSGGRRSASAALPVGYRPRCAGPPHTDKRPTAASK